MEFPNAMAGTLAEMYDLAAERPEIACKRLRYAATLVVLKAWASQIEACHGLFSDDLWHEIEKIGTFRPQDREGPQKLVSQLILNHIKENHHE